MPAGTDCIHQAAALPVKGGRICVVTSSSGKRWVIPKGVIDAGKTPAEIALQEAWEEAGLVGVLQADPLGTYFYEKYGGTYHVTVFLMQVTSEADVWPERSLRQRSWLSSRAALDRLQEPGLQEIVRSVVKVGLTE